MGTRETVNHMPGMDKSGNIHWIYWWAFATFIAGILVRPADISHIH